MKKLQPILLFMVITASWFFTCKNKIAVNNMAIKQPYHATIRAVSALLNSKEYRSEWLLLPFPSSGAHRGANINIPGGYCIQLP